MSRILKSFGKCLRSPLTILGLALVLVLAFLVHFLHFQDSKSAHEPDNVIQMLREKKVVFTNADKGPAVVQPVQPPDIDQKVAQAETNQKQSSTTQTQPNVPSTVITSTKTDDPISLPGGAEHRILGLSDTQFRSIKVSEMLGWYGQAEGGGSCAGDFGNDLINRWRDTKQTYCAAPHPVSSAHGQGEGADGEDGDLNSSIDCYLVHQTRHHGSGDNLCHMRNVAVDLALFADDTKTRPVVEHYVHTKHGQQPYIKFPKGFIEGDCWLRHELWTPSAMPGWNADLTVGAFQEVHPAGKGEGPGTAEVCSEWVEHKVLVTQRDTFANFFHDSEDFVNVFIAMAVLQWKPSEAQMYLTDLYPQGPFWEMWSKVYSQGNPDVTAGDAMTAMTAWDLRQRFQHVPKGKKVCFRDLAIGIYGPAAPVTVASWDTPCKHTALVRAYSDYVIRGLQLQGSTHYARPSPSDTIVVTYMARRPSREWPEKKYCDSEHSFFLCHLWEGFGERRLGRMVSNDQEVVKALKGLEGATMGGGKKIVVQDVDYNILTFEQQIATDLATDVMIGPHGAGLMHSVFMRDRAVLVELFVDGSSVNRHFHNMAFWYGRKYKGVTIRNPINIPELLDIVKEAVQMVDVNKY